MGHLNVLTLLTRDFVLQSPMSVESVQRLTNELLVPILTKAFEAEGRTFELQEENPSNPNLAFQVSKSLDKVVAFATTQLVKELATHGLPDVRVQIDWETPELFQVTLNASDKFQSASGMVH